MTPEPLDYVRRASPKGKIAVGICLIWTVLHGLLTCIWFGASVAIGVLNFGKSAAGLLAGLAFVVLWIFITWGLASAEQAGHTLAEHRGRNLGIWLGLLIGLLVPTALFVMPMVK